MPQSKLCCCSMIGETTGWDLELPLVSRLALESLCWTHVMLHSQKKPGKWLLPCHKPTAVATAVPALTQALETSCCDICHMSSLPLRIGDYDAFNDLNYILMSTAVAGETIVWKCTCRHLLTCSLQVCVPGEPEPTLTHVFTTVSLSCHTSSLPGGPCASAVH